MNPVGAMCRTSKLFDIHITENFKQQFKIAIIIPLGSSTEISINFADEVDSQEKYQYWYSHFCSTFKQQYWYWYQQNFIAIVLLLVLTIVFTSIANIPGLKWYWTLYGTECCILG